VNAALTIAWHQLRRMFRDPGRVLLLAAIPVTLALIEYAAFGNMARTGKLPPTRVLLLDEDSTFASNAVGQFFTGGQMKEYFTLAAVDSRDAAKRQFTTSEASALIVIPKGFQTNLLENRDAPIQLYKNPIQTFSPQIVESMLDVSSSIGNALYAQATQPLAQIKALVDAGKEPTADDIAAISRGFFEAGKRLSRLTALQDLDITVKRPAGASTRSFSDPTAFFGFMFPGLVLFGLMFISQALALRLLRDRTTGLQRRVLMAPVSRGAQIAGNALYLVVGLVVLLALLGLIGVVVFRIRLREPLTLLVFGIGFALFASALQLAIAARATSDRGAQGLAGVVIMVLALLGGTFVPADNYPPFLQSVALAMPNGATQQGMINLLVHGQRPRDVVGLLATSWTWGVVGMTIAVLFERTRRTA
jgi:ABC-type multidrug transport system permease subunit